MKKLSVPLIIILSLVFWSAGIMNAWAYFSGTEISLSSYYGGSWDGASYDLWRVLADAGYADLADDVYADINGGTKSSSYHAYRDFFFTASTGYQNELIAEIAYFAPWNRFGWYEKGHASDVGDATKTTWAEVFAGSNVAGDLASFYNSNELGLWLNPYGLTGKYYFSDTASNYIVGDVQLIAFYLGDYAGYGDEYLICMEDLRHSSSNDDDYQDMVVHLQVEPVPEPATVSLLGIGLLGILRFRRKNKQGRRL